MGRRCLKMCRILGMIPKGFLVSCPERGQVAVEDIPVTGISDFTLLKGTGIIISVGKNNLVEVENELKMRGIKDYIFF